MTIFNGQPFAADINFFSTGNADQVANEAWSGSATTGAAQIGASSGIDAGRNMDEGISSASMASETDRGTGEVDANGLFTEDSIYGPAGDQGSDSSGSARQLDDGDPYRDIDGDTGMGGPGSDSGGSARQLDDGDPYRDIDVDTGTGNQGEGIGGSLRQLDNGDPYREGEHDGDPETGTGGQGEGESYREDAPDRVADNGGAGNDSSGAQSGRPADGDNGPVSPSSDNGRPDEGGNGAGGPTSEVAEASDNSGGNGPFDTGMPNPDDPNSGSGPRTNETSLVSTDPAGNDSILNSVDIFSAYADSIAAAEQASSSVHGGLDLSVYQAFDTPASHIGLSNLGLANLGLSTSIDASHLTLDTSHLTTLAHFDAPAFDLHSIVSHAVELHM